MSQTNVLEDISKYAVCTIPEKCNGVDCCLTLPVVKHNVHIFIDIDTCDYKLTFGIEKIKLNHSLIDYEWGTLQRISLYGVINMK